MGKMPISHYMACGKAIVIIRDCRLSAPYFVVR